MSACCCLCVPDCLLDLVGLRATPAWLAAGRLEERCLALLRAHCPGLIEAACEALEQPGAQLALSDEQIALVALCDNTLQTAASGGHERQVHIDRFVCDAEVDVRSPGAPPASIHAACIHHCAEALGLGCAGRVVAYPSAWALAVDSIYTPLDDQLARVLRACHLAPAYRRAAVRACVVQPHSAGLPWRGHASGVLIRDADFASLAHYREMAQCHTQLAICMRRANCAECALSPAVAAFDRFTDGIAIPQTYIAIRPDARSIPPDYWRTWADPRCIHSDQTADVGSEATYAALLWFFGGLDNALAVFLRVVAAMVARGDSVVEAVQLVHDTAIITHQTMLRNERLSCAVRRDFIRPQLLEGRLYSYALGAVILQASASRSSGGPLLAFAHH